MVNVRNKKFGFSLAETLVSMLVLSIFFVVTSKIITVKPKAEIATNRHGYFECFVQNGALMQKRSDGTYNGEAVPAGNACHFVPPSGIANVVVYVLNDTEGLGQRFYVSAEPQFNGQDGNDTVSIDLAQLRTFHQTLEGIEEGDENVHVLMNYFQVSYPSSSIYAILNEDDTYTGPALFIGW